MNQALSDVLLGLDLQIGEQHRGDCPVCFGRNTFTVTRTLAGTLFNCYKAGCSLAGRKETSVKVSDFEESWLLEKKVPSGPLVFPPHIVGKHGRTEVTEWINKYDYPFDDVELYYDLREDRIVFPVRDQDGVIIDATGRYRGIRDYKHLSGTYNPIKWKRYGTSSHPYTSGNGNIAVVVEDAISAAVMGATEDNCTGVALLGTALLPTHVARLKCYTGVIVALDPDAANKTLKFTQELRGLLPQNKVLAARLRDDLKYRRKSDMLLIHKQVNELTQPA